MFGPLFFLFFFLFIGGRIALKTFRQFLVCFFPFLVRQRDFMNQVQSPRQILGPWVDQVDDQAALFRAGGGNPVVLPFPIGSDKRAVRSHSPIVITLTCEEGIAQ